MNKTRSGVLGLGWFSVNTAVMSVLVGLLVWPVQVSGEDADGTEPSVTTPSVEDIVRQMRSKYAAERGETTSLSAVEEHAGRLVVDPAEHIPNLQSFRASDTEFERLKNRVLAQDRMLQLYEEKDRRAQNLLTQLDKFPKVSVTTRGTTLETVLYILQQENYSIRVQDGVDLSVPVSVNFKDIPLPDALDIILSHTGYAYRLNGERAFDIYERSVLTVHVDGVSPAVYSNSMKLGSKSEGGGGGGAEQSATSAAITDLEVKIEGMDYWSALREAVKSVASTKARIIVDKTFGFLVIEDHHQSIRFIRDYLEDVIPYSLRQINVSVMVVEVEMKDEHDKGFLIEYLSPRSHYGKSHQTSGSILDDAVTVTSGMTLRFQNSKLRTVLNALEGVGRVNVVSHPSISLMNRMPGSIALTTSTPYLSKINVQTSAQGQTTRTPENARAQTGVSMLLWADIVDTETVVMSIQPRVADITEFVTITVDGQSNNLPTFKERSVISNATLRLGQGMILGGLTIDKYTDSKKNHPFLSGVPIIRDMTEKRDLDKVRSELLFVVMVDAVPSAPRHLMKEKIPGNFRLIDGSLPFGQGTPPLLSGTGAGADRTDGVAK